jgi:hypothetical protein
MKTETISFRFDKESLTALKQEAKKQHVSVNSLVNKIIKRYVEWDIFTPAIQFIPFPTSMIISMLNQLSEQKIRNIGIEHSKKHSIENLLLVKNEINVDSYLEMLKTFCEMAEFTYSMREKNNLRSFTARHNQGIKFSILFSAVINADFEELFESKVDVKETTNSVSFSIPTTHN